MQYSQKIINDQKLFYTWFNAMYTRVDLVLIAEHSREDLLQIATTIKTIIDRLESIGNRFDINSEISSINNNAYKNTTVISNELFEILEECLVYNAKTLGY